VTKIVFWQMVLGTVGFLEQLIWAATNHEPQWLILSVSMGLLGGGTILQIGRGGGNGK
jgi:hypothetical protein